MSYFFAVTGKKTSLVAQALERYYSKVCGSLRQIVLSERDFTAAYYIEEKLISDIYYRNEATDSWILLLGMPILDRDLLSSKFLDKFFADPLSTINENLDGHFGLLAYDGTDSRVYLATDYNSYIPMYYSVTGDGLTVASDEMGAGGALDAAIDPIGFAESISLGVTWSRQTRFSGVQKLQACELLTYKKGSYDIHKYWQPKCENIWSCTLEEMVGQWSRIALDGLDSMVRQAGVDSVSLDITGGEDSRMVLALCHRLGIPISNARVRGLPHDSDIEIAKRITSRINLPLELEILQRANIDDLHDHYFNIALETDGYGSIFSSAVRNATDKSFGGPKERRKLHLCGVPGGEVYRGAYYSRAKLLRPAQKSGLDVVFFTRMKYLLDHISDLYSISNDEILETINSEAKAAVAEVSQFPAGIKVDHLLRKFQTCSFGVEIRRPFYLPLGLKNVTRSIYSITPNYKRGGRLTKACTEYLYPEVAWIKTQKGVPTVKRTIGRSYLFIPEYINTLKKIAAGVPRRLLHIGQNTKMNHRHLNSYHVEAMQSILTKGKTGEWFSSVDSMMTGQMYNPKRISLLLNEAKLGNCRYVDTLGRIINAEIAMRFVDGL